MEARIDALIAHFDDLHRAHQAVLKTKAQIERLVSLVADCERHAELVRDLDHLRGCRQALRPWFAESKGNLLDRRLVMWQAELARLDNRLERVRVREQQKQQRLQRDELARAMYDNGGHRVGAIKAEMARLDAQHQEKAGRARQYGEVAAALGLVGATDNDSFDANRRAIETGHAASLAARDAGSNRLTEAGVTLRELVYWGNIDTHGYAILDRLRAYMPHARSVMMDAEHLQAHRALWGSEPADKRHGGALLRLDAAERDLFDELRDDVHGQHVRMEQERIGFGWIKNARGA